MLRSFSWDGWCLLSPVAWTRPSAVVTAVVAEVRCRICGNNLKAVFFQCPTPLSRGSADGEAELMPPQAGCCGEGNLEIQHWHCYALEAWREGKLQKQLGGQSWWLQSKQGIAQASESQMVYVSQPHISCPRTVLPFWSDTSLTPTERMHPSARQISDLSESLTRTIFLLVRKGSVAGIILQHHQH